MLSLLKNHSFLASLKRFSLFFFALFALPSILLAQTPLTEESLEKRVRLLSYDLRCLVCQNQSLEDSQAPLAQDLRQFIKERLKAGDTEAQIKAFLVDRYGDFILLKPRWKTSTWLLWLAPPLTFCLGAWWLFLLFRPSSFSSSQNVSEQEKPF